MKLEKGDLVYVEQITPTYFDYTFGLDEYLAIVDGVGTNLSLDMGMLGKFYHIVSFMDFKNNIGAHITLIEKGAFK